MPRHVCVYRVQYGALHYPHVTKLREPPQASGPLRGGSGAIYACICPVFVRIPAVWGPFWPPPPPLGWRIRDWKVLPRLQPVTAHGVSQMTTAACRLDRGEGLMPRITVDLSIDPSTRAVQRMQSWRATWLKQKNAARGNRHSSCRRAVGTL